MKKISMMGMVAMLLLAASCKKEKNSELYDGFRATVESHTDGSKTHLEGTSVKWDSDDAILVKSSSCSKPKRFTTNETGGTVNFEEAEMLPMDFYTPTYTAYYPADAYAGNKITLPAIQTYAVGSFAKDANPMAAVSETKILSFKNICGVLELRLKSTGACVVRQIEITTKGTENLWGTGTVNLSDPSSPSLSALTDGGKTVTLDCGDGIDISSEKVFRIVVPAGALGSSFEVKLTDSNNRIWARTASGAQNTIQRSHITWLGVNDISTHDPVTPTNVTLKAGCSGLIYNVGGSVSVPSGSHTCEFGFVYSETDNTPTIEEGASKFVAGTDTFSGTKEFSADLTGLTVGTTYHMRSYAMIDGVKYSTEVKDVVGDAQQDMTWTGGRSPRLFSVSGSKKVYFSQGNLQYIGSASTPYWKFANHQFDFFGLNTGQNSSNQKVDRDLFGFATSGYNHNNKSYNPWSTDQTAANYYAYDKSSYHLYSSNGMADWGKANTIANGGSNIWRTLTKDEWVYLIETRKDSNGKLLYGEGKVGNCIPGLIILPDQWTLPTGITFTPGKSDWNNVYTFLEWAKMEEAGAVFLPSSGYRVGTEVYQNDYGNYWSSMKRYSTLGIKTNAYSLTFGPSMVGPAGDIATYTGFSVRLVSDN